MRKLSLELEELNFTCAIRCDSGASVGSVVGAGCVGSVVGAGCVGSIVFVAVGRDSVGAGVVVALGAGLGGSWLTLSSEQHST